MLDHIFRQGYGYVCSSMCQGLYHCHYINPGINNQSIKQGTWITLNCYIHQFKEIRLYQENKYPNRPPRLLLVKPGQIRNISISAGTGKKTIPNRKIQLWKKTSQKTGIYPMGKSCNLSNHLWCLRAVAGFCAAMEELVLRPDLINIIKIPLVSRGACRWRCGRLIAMRGGVQEGVDQCPLVSAQPPPAMTCLPMVFLTL